MPFYYRIKGNTPEGRRTAERLLDLKAQLEDEIPQRSVNDTLLLATWNIREFDSPTMGSRLDESFYYIAEIISHFDLVAIQEVREDLVALNGLMRILGSHWKYLFTDVTEGRAGNRERMAFVYDSRKVRFGGLAGEIVLEPVRKDKKTYEPARQLARTPFISGFRAGWFKFMLSTVHILYGTQKSDDPKRVEEIRQLSKFLARRASHRSAWSNNLILLGDFNIFRPQDVTFTAMTDAGFFVPEALQNLPSNVPQNKHYDQIAFILKEDEMQFRRAGVFNYYNTVFREADESLYIKAMGEGYRKTKSGKERDERGKRIYYRTYWRTHQMSDHLPMWVELGINFSKAYLRDKAAAV